MAIGDYPGRAARQGFLFLLLCGMTLAVGMGALAQEKPAALPLPLKVVGTQVQNSRGERVALRGVNAASMEWSSDGEGHILQTVRTAIEDWHANIVRLPLAQDRWFGKAPEQTDGGKAYRALVKQVVDTCAARVTYILLDLHWSDMGEWGKQIGQHVMPDKNSMAFWKDIAPIYKNHPAVLFDLYNEPHDTTWDIWLKGGTVKEKNRKTGEETTYEAVGMQALLDTVRATGAKNVIVAGGLDWAYDLSGILDGRQLSDPTGNGVIYANHAYPFKGDTVEQWIAKMEKATQKLPVIVSEFGAEARRRPNPPAANAPGANPAPATNPPAALPPGMRLPPGEWVAQVLKALQDHDWNWTAWDLHPAAGPRLISNWNYTPTPSFGVPVKQALTGTPTPIPPSSTAPVGADSTAPGEGISMLAADALFSAPITRLETAGAHITVATTAPFTRSLAQTITAAKDSSTWRRVLTPLSMGKTKTLDEVRHRY